jgi:hypothetical protein
MIGYNAWQYIDHAFIDARHLYYIMVAKDKPSFHALHHDYNNVSLDWYYYYRHIVCFHTSIIQKSYRNGTIATTAHW